MHKLGHKSGQVKSSSLGDTTMERTSKRIDNKVVYLQTSSTYVDDAGSKHVPVWVGKDKKYWGEKVISGKSVKFVAAK